LSSVDLLRAYDALPLTNAGLNGQGETVVFMEGGGFLQSDFNTFAADEKLPAYNLTLVGKNTGYDDETTMDIETVHEIAPQAHLVFFNLNSISKATSDADLFAQAFIESAKLWPGAIVSMSLGECETNTQAFNDSDLVALNSTVMSIEAKGSTVFASSGDSGGLDCTPNADDGQAPQSSFEGVLVPASLPAVTGTGGTSMTTDAAGNYIGETTWSEPLLSQGTGGGVSHYFARPSWETGVGTGGTVMGVGAYLKSRHAAVRVHPLEPSNSPTLSTGYKVGKHRIQGISDEFIPDIVRLDQLDEVVAVDDGDAIIMAQMLAGQLGLGVGISSGANLLGALLVQERLGREAVVVTIFSDDNKKYLSTDLMRQVKAGYLTSDIQLTAFGAAKRVCRTCCDGASCQYLDGPGIGAARPCKA